MATSSGRRQGGPSGLGVAAGAGVLAAAPAVPAEAAGGVGEAGPDGDGELGLGAGPTCAQEVSSTTGLRGSALPPTPDRSVK
jgi:hypothetical protein